MLDIYQDPTTGDFYVIIPSLLYEHCGYMDIYNNNLSLLDFRDKSNLLGFKDNGLCHLYCEVTIMSGRRTPRT